MNCPSCGRQTPDNGTFCAHCGTRLTPATSSRQAGGVNIPGAGNVSVGQDIVGRDKVTVQAPAKIAHRLTISKGGKILGILIGLGLAAGGVVLLFAIDFPIAGWVVIGFGVLWALNYLVTPSD